tara:strand:+ start:344 stop:493 length:150 start_codon:yes stop_codon:yes gene_type:complete
MLRYCGHSEDTQICIPKQGEKILQDGNFHAECQMAIAVPDIAWGALWHA